MQDFDEYSDDLKEDEHSSADTAEDTGSDSDENMHQMTILPTEEEQKLYEVT